MVAGFGFGVPRDSIHCWGKKQEGFSCNKHLLNVQMGKSAMMTAEGMVFRDMKAAKFLLTENSGFILGEHQFISVGLLKKHSLVERVPGKSSTGLGKSFIGHCGIACI